jgi:hypothetical protein
MNEKKTVFVSKRLEEVLAVKEALYQEVAHLPVDEALKALLEMAHEAAKDCPFLREAAPRRR